MKTYFDELEMTKQYNINERDWVCKALTQLILIFLGLTVYRAASISIAPGSSWRTCQIIGLMVYEGVILGILIKILFDSTKIGEDIPENEIPKWFSND